MGMTHNLLNSSVEVKLPETNDDSINKAIKLAVSKTNNNGRRNRNKKIILSTVITEIHKALHEGSPVKSDHKSIERKEESKLAKVFPKIQRARRGGFIVDKTISKKLKIK